MSIIMLSAKKNQHIFSCNNCFDSGFLVKSLEDVRQIDIYDLGSYCHCKVADLIKSMMMKASKKQFEILCFRRVEELKKIFPLTDFEEESKLKDQIGEDRRQDNFLRVLPVELPESFDEKESNDRNCLGFVEEKTQISSFYDDSFEIKKTEEIKAKLEQNIKIIEIERSHKQNLFDQGCPTCHSNRAILRGAGTVIAEACDTCASSDLSFIKICNEACIPGDYLSAFLEPRKDFSQTKNIALFFGSSGTGKTHTAISILRDSLNQGQHVGYLDCIDFARGIDWNSAGIALNDWMEAKHDAYFFQGIGSKPFLVVDNLGSQPFTKKEEGLFKRFLQFRMLKGLKTIFVSSVWKVEDLRVKIGDENYSRIASADLFPFKGKNLWFKSEEKAFSLPKKLFFLKSDELLVQNFLVRNPIFRSISKKERNQIGNKPREKITFSKGAWNKNDQVEVSGSVCDFGDLKIYMLLLRDLIMKVVHSNGVLSKSYCGVEICSILKMMNQKKGGENLRILKERISRLAEMNITYISNNVTISGSLILIKDDKIMVNMSFLSLLEKGFYAIVNEKELSEYKGYDFGIYLFLKTHSKVQNISNENWIMILGLEETNQKEKGRRLLLISKKFKNF